MAPMTTYWVDPLTRVTFLAAGKLFTPEAEWHVDFCAMPENPDPRTVDPRQVYQTIRVRETENGWTPYDLCTPFVAAKAVAAVEQFEMTRDTEQVTETDRIRRVAAGMVLAGVPTVSLLGLAA